MKLFKKFLIWIPIITLASVIGVLAAFLIMDKQVEESAMAIGVTGGILGGALIAVGRHLRAKNKI